MKKSLKFGVDIEVRQGQNCIKLEVYGQTRMQMKEIKRRRTKLNFDQTPKLKPKTQNGTVLKTVKKKRQTIIVFFPFRLKKHGHLMFYLPIKFDKKCMKLMA
jgi:hypothetical protein